MSTYCYECGQRLVPGARYCAACGQPTPPSNHTRETRQETAYRQPPRPEPQPRSYAEPVAPKRAWPWGWIVIAVIVGGFILWSVIDEQSTKDDINAQNQAAAADSGASSSGTSVANVEDEISVFDLRTGDCITSGGTGSVASLTRVPCTSSRANLEVIESFTITRTGDYPPERYFDAQFERRCPANATEYLLPTRESWASGDRTINCLAPVN